jgi:hypothetical protein
VFDLLDSTHGQEESVPLFPYAALVGLFKSFINGILCSMLIDPSVSSTGLQESSLLMKELSL